KNKMRHDGIIRLARSCEMESARAANSVCPSPRSFAGRGWRAPISAFTRVSTCYGREPGEGQRRPLIGRGFASRAAPHPALASLGPPSPRCRGARERTECAVLKCFKQTDKL